MSSHNEAESAHHSPVQYVSIIILFFILIAIPVTIAYLGQMTRSRLRAANECTQPEIPDPSECVGGTWELYKTQDSCVRFRCQIP